MGQYYSAKGVLKPRGRSKRDAPRQPRGRSKRDAPRQYREWPGGQDYARDYDHCIEKKDYTKRGLQVVELDNGDVVPKKARMRYVKWSIDDFNEILHKTHKRVFDPECKLCIRDKKKHAEWCQRENQS